MRWSIQRGLRKIHENKVCKSHRGGMWYQERRPESDITQLIQKMKALYLKSRKSMVTLWRTVSDEGRNPTAMDLVVSGK